MDATCRASLATVLPRVASGSSTHALPGTAMLHAPGIHKCYMKTLTIFELEQTTTTMSQLGGQTGATFCGQQSFFDNVKKGIYFTKINDFM